MAYTKWYRKVFCRRCDKTWATLLQKGPVLMYAYLQHQMLAAKERKLQLTQF